jgi:hypothetical protein
MRIFKYLIYALMILLLLDACKEEREDQLRLEKERLKKELNTKEISLYKGVKILVRSVSSQNDESGLAYEILSFFNHHAGIKDFTVSEIYKTVKSYKNLKDSVMFLNEDDYPTLLSN